MRAIFEREKKLEVGSCLVISDERAHHLNVVRTKTDDMILVLDGVGRKAFTKVVSITKKEIHLHIDEIQEEHKTSKAALFVSVPKKDAFEDILKNATECGFTDIYPLTTNFSQYIFENNERVNKIIESAMIQSNNLFRPLIHDQKELKDFLKDPDIKFTSTFLFTSFEQKPFSAIKRELNLNSWGVFIGPEAGFSNEEEGLIISSKFEPIVVHLPTPILRAPTAVAVSVGYVIGLQQK